MYTLYCCIDNVNCNIVALYAFWCSAPTIQQILRVYINTFCVNSCNIINNLYETQIYILYIYYTYYIYIVCVYKRSMSTYVWFYNALSIRHIDDLASTFIRNRFLYGECINFISTFFNIVENPFVLKYNCCLKVWPLRRILVSMHDMHFMFTTLNIRSNFPVYPFVVVVVVAFICVLFSI